MNTDRRVFPLLGAAALLIGLPLVGGVLAGRPASAYLEFPPLTRYVDHAPFSWVAFAIFALVPLAAVLPFVRRVAVGHVGPSSPGTRRFPLWGWGGVVFGAAVWALAWTRLEFFRPLQPFTFSPLWWSYIVVVNAVTYRRTGRSMLTHQPRYVLGLFVFSAAFWWYFEYLNRFVQNWYYVGVGTLTPLQYFVFATLPFATVLPAVAGTYELMRTYPVFSGGLDSFWRCRIRCPRTVAAAALAISSAALAGIALWPDILFPVLWVSPVAMMVSLQVLSGSRTVFAPVVERGDWRDIWLYALAALVCGFFWEMWNFHSLAKWIYAVPFVNRFRVFEMPVLGFAGYLPFGLECAVIADVLRRRRATSSEGEATRSGGSDGTRTRNNQIDNLGL